MNTLENRKPYKKEKNICSKLYKKKRQNMYFFLSVFDFTYTDDSQDSRGREGTNFFSTLPFPPTHEHSDITFATLYLILS